MTNREEFELTDKIINRAESLGIIQDKRINHMMDIELATKLFNMNLVEWLLADELNFTHDFIGIYNNVDRVNINFGFYLIKIKIMIQIIY